MIPLADIRTHLPRTTQAALGRLGHEWRLFLESARTIGKGLSKDPAWAPALAGAGENHLGHAIGVLTIVVDADGENPRMLIAEPSREWGLYLCWLRLPALRERWERLLRRSHLESLQKVLPDAWILDPKPVPPGAVIRGLGIGGWLDLAKQQVVQKWVLLNHKDQLFAFDNTQMTEGHISAFSDALALFPERPSLLIEQPFGAQVFRAEYAEDRGRVGLKSLTRLPPEPSAQAT